MAIPNFAAGAMENWGLLMYRERALLVDDSRDDMHQRYAIATTVSHEVVRRAAWCSRLAVHGVYCGVFRSWELGSWRCKVWFPGACMFSLGRLSLATDGIQKRIS